MAIWVRSMSPSATAAITLRADSSTRLDGLGGVEPRHGDGLLRRGLAARWPQFLGAQNARLHGVDFHDAIGQRAHHLLLIGQGLHVLLRGRAGGKQSELLGVGQQLVLGGQRSFAFFGRRSGRTSLHPSAS